MYVYSNKESYSLDQYIVHVRSSSQHNTLQVVHNSINWPKLDNYIATWRFKATKSFDEYH